jgi:hypothetical protein
MCEILNVVYGNLYREVCVDYHHIQGVSRLVDITTGGDFLGLCDKKSSYKYVSDFGRLRSYVHFFNSRTPLCVNRVLRNQLRCGEGGASGYSPGQCILHDSATTYYTRNARGSQPSGSLCCGRRWHFRKPALDTDQFKLKVISRSYLYIYTLNVSCIMLVYYFVPFIVNNRYLLF